MTQAIKDEALAQIQKEILLGFYDEATIAEIIQDLFYDVENFDSDWLNAEIRKQFTHHQKTSQQWQKPTDFDRLVSVFDQLNKEKIVSLHRAGYTRQDAEGDCREIIDELSNLGIQAKGYCYYHTQDAERVMEEEVLFIGFDSVNFNDEVALEIANRIIELLQENNFQTSWNNSVETRIKILNINWQKAYDGIDYNYNRVFSIIQKEHSPEKKEVSKKSFWKFWK
ncbi:hypothetical protein [uncultured Kordia sp.]|uniref:DUF6891 domain-containing protein n=1 Tax=uncultured Kordia sp. TaxID=507699 RepID=UPI0026263A84|nr:hypothetical protein [uncultured Kordia sp.]